jgi:hypothetical protein
MLSQTYVCHFENLTCCGSSEQFVCFEASKRMFVISAEALKNSEWLFSAYEKKGKDIRTSFERVVFQ